MVFSTREQPDLSLSIKVKTDGGQSKPFSEDKLCLSIYGSLSHKKEALEAARALSDTVIGRLLPLKDKTVERNQIITLVYEVLKRYDRAAATYYKAHHPL